MLGASRACSCASCCDELGRIDQVRRRTKKKGGGGSVQGNNNNNNDRTRTKGWSDHAAAPEAKRALKHESTEVAARRVCVCACVRVRVCVCACVREMYEWPSGSAEFVSLFCSFRLCLRFFCF